MSDFSDAFSRFSAKVEFKSRAHFINTCAAVKSSITDGSPLTGAPGQPVDTSNLKNSWQLTFDSPTLATISTNVAYAEAVEDAVGPHGARAYGKERADTSKGSTVGGSHSVKLTMASLHRIVDDEAKKLA